MPKVAIVGGYHLHDLHDLGVMLPVLETLRQQPPRPLGTIRKLAGQRTNRATTDPAASAEQTQTIDLGGGVLVDVLA